MASTADILRLHAGVVSQIRAFFAGRGVVEAVTPVLVGAAASDFATHSFRTDAGWLRTSPEAEMKRLLMDGSGDIYQVGPVFRKSETGKRHRAEFTMLEWYRIGWDYRRLLKETGELLAQLLSAQEPRIFTYQSAFENCFGIDPFDCDDTVLQERAAGAGLAGCSGRGEALDFLFERLTGLHPPADGLYAIVDFPAEQASLARMSAARRAERFEVFHGNLELANGYREITDSDEYLARLEGDNRVRARLGLEPVAGDPAFIKALQTGTLPECSGVSVGIDRLLMCLAGAGDIGQVRTLDT